MTIQNVVRETEFYHLINEKSQFGTICNILDYCNIGYSDLEYNYNDLVRCVDETERPLIKILGDVEMIHEASYTGDEGGGESVKMYLYFPKYNVYMKCYGYYASYVGTKWEGKMEAFPVIKTELDFVDSKPSRFTDSEVLDNEVTETFNSKLDKVKEYYKRSEEFKNEKNTNRESSISFDFT